MTDRLRFYTKTALAAAILSLLAPFAIPLGVIPLSFASLAISILAGLLGPGVGFLAVLIYLAIGAVGVPVYSGFTAGFGVLFGPSVGFFVGYIVLSLVAGFACRGKTAHRPWRTLPLLLLGELLLVSLGAVGYALMLKISLAKAMLVAFLPFLLPAILKAAFASYLIGRLRASKLSRIL